MTDKQLHLEPEESVDARNGWNEWSRYVLIELKRLSRELVDLYGKLNALENRLTTIESKAVTRDDIQSLREEITKLKVKSGVWGLVGGAIPTVAVLIIWWVEHAAVVAQTAQKVVQP
jgi:hypothetical protein